MVVFAGCRWGCSSRDLGRFASNALPLTMVSESMFIVVIVVAGSLAFAWLRWRETLAPWPTVNVPR